MKRIFTLLILTLISTQALAVDGSIPWAFLKLQIANFAVFAILIVYLSRSKIAPVFKVIKDEYLKKSQEAQFKLETAEKKRDDLINKILKLEEERSASLVKAKEQAEEKYRVKMLQVKDSVSALNKDLEGQIAGLKRSQATKLKNLLMDTSITELKKDLGSDVDEELLIQLQNSFVESVVRV